MANQQASINFPFYTLEANGPGGAHAQVDMHAFVESAGPLSPEDLAQGIRAYLDSLPAFTSVVMNRFESVQTLI